jgi:hypothetical protein
VILPPWCRKSPKIAEVLWLLYLHGLSTGDFVPALEAFVGSSAGLSAAAGANALGRWAPPAAGAFACWPVSSAGRWCASVGQ